MTYPYLQIVVALVCILSAVAMMAAFLYLHSKRRLSMRAEHIWVFIITLLCMLPFAASLLWELWE